MFGSDQMVWPEAIGMAVEAINSADFLTSEQKADIFYGIRRPLSPTLGKLKLITTASGHGRWG